MGWPGPRRRTVPLKLSEEEERPVRAIADAEHDGNLSAAIRALLAKDREIVQMAITHRATYHRYRRRDRGPRDCKPRRRGLPVTSPRAGRPHPFKVV